ncbi:xanthine dehydrogenase [Thermanaerosceptrum fracticalcis]|uniref:Xanthine dehydrogenase n=1 Tax=Thermanaerosceptrum fracticalcis TaxID=1712410 RepID=A0A7G6E334_THEFR|nr:XdhC family protein [Thermanaerosceptrum fracticalcis]QNB46488.1 xanthine dehydrogenase [Thermanaerosceptrum fracticalcis]
MMKIYQKIVELLEQGEVIALARITSQKGSAPRGSGAKMLVRQDGSIFGTIGGGPLEARVIQEAKESIAKRENKLLEYDLNKELSGGLNMQCGGQVQVSIEIIAPPPHLIIAGAGHIGQVLAQFAHALDWQVSVVDDREELLAPGKLPPGVCGVWGETYVEAIRKVKITHNAYIVIVTKDADAQVLEEVIHSPAAYIGMIGSQRKVALVKKNLEQKGVDPERLQAVHAPIGLDIKAETPAEIAVSILGEIIMVMRGGHDPRPMSVVSW